MSILDFLEMMPQTITHKPFVSRDEYGAKTYGTSVVYKARVVHQPKKVRNKEGFDIIAKGSIWVGPPSSNTTNSTPISVSTEDQILLPDNSEAEILSIENIPDENGDHHTKIFFG